MKLGASPQLLNPRARSASRPDARQSLVVARVDVGRLSRERVADLRRNLVSGPHRVSGQRPELAEDGRLLHEVDTERDERARIEQRATELIDLILLRIRLQGRIIEALVVLLARWRSAPTSGSG